jgi:flagellin
MVANSGWQSASDITASAEAVDSALNTLRFRSTSLSSSSNVVSARIAFNDALIAILQAGAVNLTLADLDEEGATMLMLQTRQSLGTTSLAIGSQAAQSVCRLFK